MNRPTLTIIAGANGAGKSTLTAGSPGTFGAIPLLDPDAFANTLRSNETGMSTIAAGKEVLRLAKEHLKRRESFAVETTLSGKNYLQMMRYARGIDRGFEVVLIYIGTERVERPVLWSKGTSRLVTNLVPWSRGWWLGPGSTSIGW